VHQIRAFEWNSRHQRVLRAVANQAGWWEAFSLKVGDVMTPDIEVVAPDDTLKTAARLMEELDSGALPVSEDNRLLGIITGRDIAIQVVAEGRDPETTTVRQAMSTDVLYCCEDESAEDDSRKMGDWWVRRLPVVTQDKRLRGIVSLGELEPAGSASKEAAG
jgi:CBS domain-containing protein